MYFLRRLELCMYPGVFFCACCLGMGVMGFLMGMYYFSFFPSTPGASLEHTGMYDYENEYQTLKRDVNDQTEETVVEDFYDESATGRRSLSETNKNTGMWSQKTYSEDHEPDTSGTQKLKGPFSSLEEVEDNVIISEGEDGIIRGKRNDTTSFASDVTSATTADQNSRTPTTLPSTESKGKHKTHSQTTSTTATTMDDSDPDFQLSNTFIDRVFNRAENANLKDPLGLCRSSADIKIPNFNITYFPVDDANDILACINSIMKNQTGNKLCIQLNSELYAYLKWLVLTGEPKEKRKPQKVPSADDFLFPPSCGSQETPRDTGPQSTRK